jgi:small subunit ribosomal protein S5
MQTARKDLHSVALNKETIYYETTGKHGASKVFMRPAADGTGIIAGGAMRAVFECVGIRNVLAKSYGSRNPINLVRATINALDHIRSPERVAKRRGIPLSRTFS